MPDPLPLSVILIGNYVPDHQESMLRFASMLEKGLRNGGIDAQIVHPRPVLNRFKAGGDFLGKWIGYIDKFILFPLVLRNLARTQVPSRVLFHICDHSNAMYGSCLGNRWLVTCHDLLAIQSARGEVPENPTRFSGRILQSWILKSLRKARHVACVSDYTARQVIRLTGLPTECLRVIPLGQNESFRPIDKVRSGEILDGLFKSRGMNRPVRYLLHVGGNPWYKNRLGLVKIFAEIASVRSDIQLVFAGKLLPTELLMLIERKSLGSRILNIGEVSHEELNSLYSAAESLVFPSLAEGFGWPLIEAQASGCPVIVSDRPPLNEIAGDSAILIDPLAAKESAQTILDFLNWAPEARAQLIQRGMANSDKFDTARMINGYLELYRDIISEGTA